MSRAALTGLGADGNGSSYTFLLGSLLAGANANTIYEWRAEAGNVLMNAGFEDFKNLYNHGTKDDIAWDINQLKNEQNVLQSIHEKYLTNRDWFRTVTKKVSNVNILDYSSHINFGCKLLGYGEVKECRP